MKGKKMNKNHSLNITTNPASTLMGENDAKPFTIKNAVKVEKTKLTIFSDPRFYIVINSALLSIFNNLFRENLSNGLHTFISISSVFLFIAGSILFLADKNRKNRLIAKAVYLISFLIGMWLIANTINLPVQ